MALSPMSRRNYELQPSLCFSLTIVGALVLLACGVGGQPRTCIREKGSTCSCEMSDGSGTFDLTPMVQTGAVPLKVAADHQTVVLYSPCLPLNFSAPCTVSSDGAVCVQSAGSVSPSYDLVAVQRGVVFSVLPGEESYVVQLNYSGPSGRQTFAVVNYHCSQSGIQFVRDPRSDWLHDRYVLNVTSRYTCLIRPGTGRRSLSVGSILCITFAVAMFTYFAFGTIFMVKFREKSGVEAIPNLTFWVQLPGLIKDGIDFIINKYRTMFSSLGYEKY